jgi:hypothetical protein
MKITFVLTVGLWAFAAGILAGGLLAYHASLQVGCPCAKGCCK